MSGDQTPPEDARHRRRAALLLPVLFFTLFLAYLVLRADPRVIYYFPTDQFPRFRLNCTFLAGCLGRPGGPVAWGSAFLSQLFVLPRAGALLVTALSVLLSLGAWHYLCSLRPSVFVPLCLVPAVLVLVLYGGHVHVLSLCVAMVVAAGASGSPACAGSPSLHTPSEFETSDWGAEATFGLGNYWWFTASIFAAQSGAV